MNWMNAIRSLDDVKRIHNNRLLLPGEPEPAALRRAAEYARELPLLRAERRAARANTPRQRWLDRLLLVVSRG